MAVTLIQRIQDNDPTLTECTIGPLELQQGAGVVALASALNVNSVLQEPDLSGCYGVSPLCNPSLSAEQSKVLAEGLKVNRNLQILNLSHITLNEEGGKAIAEALTENCTLKKLDLTDTFLGEKSGKALAKALTVNATLQQLILSHNRWLTPQEEGWKFANALAEALKVNRSLLKLDLSDVGLLNANPIMEALKDNYTLQVLDLEGCHLSSHLENLHEALKANHALQVLNLGKCGLGSKGIEMLAEGLKRNHTLRELSLTECGLINKGAESLAEALKVNQTLQVLDLVGCYFGHKGFKALAGALKINQTLQALNLRSVGFINKDKEEQAETVTGPSLQHLYYWKCLPDHEGVQAIVVALKANQTLKRLNLTGFYLGPEGGGTIATVMQYNRTLLELYFDGGDEDVSRMVKRRLQENASLARDGEEKEVKELDNTLSPVGRPAEVVAEAGPMASAAAVGMDFANPPMSSEAGPQNQHPSFAESLWQQTEDIPDTRSVAVAEAGPMASAAAVGIDFANPPMSSEARPQTQPPSFAESLWQQAEVIPETRSIASAAAAPVQAPSSTVADGLSEPELKASVGEVVVLDPRDVQKLRAFPEVAEMHRAARTLESLDAVALQALAGRAAQLQRLFESEARAYHRDAEMMRIEANPSLSTYYRYFSRLMTGTWLACQSINSKMVADDSMDLSDYLASGLKQLGGHIPGISLVTGLIADAIHAWNKRERKQLIQRLSLLFPDLEIANRDLSILARQMTLAQETVIMQPSPLGMGAAVKESIRNATAALLASDVDDHVKQKVVADCTNIFVAIREGRPKLNPTMPELLSTVLGAGFVYQTVVTHADIGPGSRTEPSKVDVSFAETLSQMQREMQQLRTRVAEAERQAQEAREEAERAKKMAKDKGSDEVIVSGGNSVQAQLNANSASHGRHERSSEVLHERVLLLEQQVGGIQGQVVYLDHTSAEHGVHIDGLRGNQSNLSRKMRQDKEGKCIIA